MFRRMFTVALGLLSVAIVTSLYAAQTGSSSPQNKDSSTLVPGKDKITLEEKKIKERFDQFMQQLIRLKERLENGNEQDKAYAVILGKTIDQAKNQAIDVQFDRLVKLLNDKDFEGINKVRTAVEKSERLVKDLQHLLNTLRQEKDLAELQAERIRLQKLIDQIDDILKEQQFVKGKAENAKFNDANPKDIEDAQKNVTEKTAKLANSIGKDGKGGQGGEAKISKADIKGAGKGKGSKGSSKGEAKAGDGKGDGKKGDGGQQGKAKGGDGKDGDGKGTDGKKGKDAGQGKGAGDNKKNAQGDAKGGDGKGADGKKPGDAKGGQGKGGAGKKPGDAKGGGKKGGGSPKAGGAKKGGQGGGKKGGGSPKAGGKGGAKAGGKQGGAKAGGSKGGGKKAGDDKKDNPGAPKQASKGEQGKAKGGDKGNQGASKSSGSKGGGSKGGSQGSAKGGGQKSGGNSGGSSSGGDGKKKKETPQSYAKKKIQDANHYQKIAEKKIDPKPEEAVPDQTKAEEELKSAKQKLEEILRQLREEELERVLAALQIRCEHMLLMQIAVRDATVSIMDSVKRNNDQITQFHKSDSLKQSDKEKEIIEEADKAIALLKSEGSSVAFPEVFRQVKLDMIDVAQRLEKAKVKGDDGEITVVIENDIIKTLEEMVAALKKARDDNKKKKSKSTDGKPGKPGDEKLYKLIQDLKLIRSQQLRINNRTKLYSNMYKGEQTNDPAIQKKLQELADRQEIWSEKVRILAQGDNK